jgi:hypothetical protein
MSTERTGRGTAASVGAALDNGRFGGAGLEELAYFRINAFVLVLGAFFFGLGLAGQLGPI